MIHSADELDAHIRDVGLLPFVKCGIDGLSLEECTPKDRWFVKDVEGPWEWREVIADQGVVAYGKFFNKKAGFVSPELYPDLVNYRRNGQSFDDLYQDGMLTRNEKRLMDLLCDRGPLLSNDLKALSGLAKGFDSAITRLQMGAFVTIRRLEYKLDAYGKPYGWGMARYARGEDAFTEPFVLSRMDKAPETSYLVLYEHVAAHFPHANEQQIRSFLR